MSLNLGQHVSAARSPRREAQQAAAAAAAANAAAALAVVYTVDPHVEKKIAPLIARIRDLALRRGDGAFRDVGVLLGVGRGAAVAKGRRANSYNSNEVVKVNPEAFKIAIARFGIVLTTADVDMLLLAFKDAVGYLVVSHFMYHLQNTMNATRAAVVQQAFKSLPKDADGLVDVQSMVEGYHPHSHPLVATGQTTPENVARQLFDAFDPSANKAPNGKVSRDEFNSYYAGISYGIRDDDQFVEMVRGLWDLYDKPPPPAVERCFIPSANAASAERWTTTTSCSRNTANPSAPHCIVGYTGHLPGASEHYGESFATTQSHISGVVLSGLKERYVPQAGEHVDEPLNLRPPNKANKHNHTFA